MTINNYRDAAALFSTARKPEKGKPLDTKGWRLFKDGDEFVLNCCGREWRDSTQVARILPDDTLRLCLDVGYIPQSVPCSARNVLPIDIVRRSTGHYRLHVRQPGGLVGYYAGYGLSSWQEWRTKGARLFDGLTVDLKTRTVVGAKEIVTKVADTEARKDWLRKSKRLKTYLKTVAKLGGFTARIEAIKASNFVRWQVPYFGSEADIHQFIAALDGHDTEPLVQRLAEAMYRHYYTPPGTKQQQDYIDTVFTANSLALRKALGVIEEVKE